MQTQVFAHIGISGDHEPVNRNQEPAEKHGEGKRHQGDDRHADHQEQYRRETVPLEIMAGAGDHTQEGGGDVARIARGTEFLRAGNRPHPIALGAFGRVYFEVFSTVRAAETGFRKRFDLHSINVTLNRRSARV